MLTFPTLRNTSRLRIPRALNAVCLAAFSILLGGCDLVVMNPAGDVAVQQKNLIIASTALMMLVVVPVISAAFIFAWRYRATNSDATYDPDFHHSTQLEVVIWTVPLLIVIALGAMAWISTHTLDPFRPLSRLGPNRAVPADVKPLDVQVVALDWKWLFILPEYGVASVNEMAAPVDRPIRFRITSSSVWNTFYVPALAGMIYAMPGMETQLNAVINKEGNFTGLSGHYSGTGFSRMNFAFRGVSGQGFDEWIAKAKGTSAPLDRVAYLKLEKPSEGEAVRYFGTVESGLYDAILGLCVQPSQLCLRDVHHIDRMGAGKEKMIDPKRLEYDSRRLSSGDEPGGATTPASGRPARSDEPPQGTLPHQQGGGPAGPERNSAAPEQGSGQSPAPPQLTVPPAGRHQH